LHIDIKVKMPIASLAIEVRLIIAK